MSDKLTTRRELHPEIRVLDGRKGLVEYVASDETIDSYREVIKASGWRFNHFKKNAPFVDSHDYSSIESLLGKVVDYGVRRKRLVETVQWAKDVTASRLAQIGYQLTEGGFLKAVSVGFWPVRRVSRFAGDRAAYLDELRELGYSEANGPETIYLEQEQIELSAVIIGANPNAITMTLAKGYKAGVLSDGDLEYFSTRRFERTLGKARGQTNRALSDEEFLAEFERLCRSL